MNKILLVEDDKNISELINDYLAGEGYEVETVSNGPKALAAFQKDSFDLVLLDIMLPHVSGIQVLKNIRQISTVPIIMVTARDNDTDKTMGLNLGADDYVTKPFSLIELSARIRANIRRATSYQIKSGEGDSVIRIKDLEINCTRHSVTRGTKLLHLTYTEFEILKLLAMNPGQAFSKEQLYRQIWKEPYYGNENVLNAHMNRLRNKLKAHEDDSKEYIKTLWGIGYKMEVE